MSWFIQTSRKQLATKTACESAPSIGGVKKHRHCPGKVALGEISVSQNATDPIQQALPSGPGVRKSSDPQNISVLSERSPGCFAEGKRGLAGVACLRHQPVGCPRQPRRNCARRHPALRLGSP